MRELLLRATAPENDASVAPRAVVVVAHPDDETLALGARLARFRKARFIHVTDGAPRNRYDSRVHGFGTLADYRQARQRELYQALGLAGIPEDHLVCLGISDQEAALRLCEITKSLGRLLALWQPKVIVTHPYEGGHPDHDACAFAVHQAVLIAESQGKPRALIVEAAFYHAGSNGMVTEEFLPAAQSVEEVTYALSLEEQRRKRALLACFNTQVETLQSFPLVRECFRTAPQYDFSRPPQPPPTLYDLRPWGMLSDRFCELAGEAEHQLQDERTRPWP